MQGAAQGVVWALNAVGMAGHRRGALTHGCDSHTQRGITHLSVFTLAFDMEALSVVAASTDIILFCQFSKSLFQLGSGKRMKPQSPRPSTVYNEFTSF